MLFRLFSTSLCAVVLVLLAGGCTFNDTEVYVNPVLPPDPSGATINLNAAEGTIEINNTTSFSFTSVPPGQKNYKATITLGSATLGEFSSTTGEFFFRLDPGLVGDGDRTLTIVVSYPSGSPSLAGQLGLESIVVTKTWPVHIDTSRPLPLAAPDVFVQDGKSMITWKTPDRFSFTELIILRQYIEGITVVHVDSIKVPDKHATSFHDASYVGGKVTYTIDLKGYKYYVKGGQKSFEITPFTFRLDNQSPTPAVRWERSPLYNNDIQLAVYDTRTFPPNVPNSLDVLGRFGQSSYITFRVMALNPPPSYYREPYQYQVNVTTYRGIQIPKHQSVAHISSLNAYLLMGEYTLYKRDGPTLLGTGTLALPVYGALVVSPDQSQVYVYGGSSLYQINLNTMQIANVINLSTINGNHNQGMTSVPTVSNDNILTAPGYNNTGVVIDLNARTVINQSGNGAPKISPDGQYLLWGSTVYKKNGSDWTTLVGTLSGSENAYDFDFLQGPKNYVMAWNYTDDKIYFYDLESTPVNGALVKAATFDHARNVSFDRNSKQFLWMDAPMSYAGDGYVFDALTHEQTNSLLNISEPGQTHFVNGHLFHNSGYYLP